MMRTLFAALSVACPTLIGTACMAATIEPVQGALSVNQGQGFEQVNGRIDANVGDTVMVSPNGSALISYPDGCKVNVQPGAVMTIAPISPCASGSYATDNGDNAVAGYIVGAGALAAVGVGIYEATQMKSAAPASP